MNILSFSPKTVAEKITLAFNFATIGVMSPAETISTQEVTVSVQKGTDPNPSAILNGPCLLDPNNRLRALQKIQNGIDGVVYHFVAQVTTSSGNVYEIHRVLRVENR
jgi:hypothetical protein